MRETEKVMLFNKEFIKTALESAQVLHEGSMQDPRISIDTRTLVAGDFFVALVGTRVDGHDFVEQAIAKGAGGLMIAADKKQVLAGIARSVLSKKLVIVVDDTLEALTIFAAAWRAQFNYPVVGITGSVGKTSTREMICNILRVQGESFVATTANYNTAIGLAINLFNMRAHHKTAIFELGIGKRGQMSKLADMLRPTTAVITTVGHSHMEGLGSLADIAAEKREIFKHFKADNVGVINGDQPVLACIGYNHPVVKFGAKTTNQVQARKVRVANDRVNMVLKLYKQKFSVVLCNGGHEAGVYNALAAASVGYLLGIDARTILAGIAQPLAVHGRFERLSLKKGAGFIISDCYNASPESMKAAILAFEHIKTDATKIAVLGDMLELGVDAPFWHRQVGRFLRKAPSIQHVVLVGDLVESTQPLVPFAIKVHRAKTAQDAVPLLKSLVGGEAAILVKGSLAMHLETVVLAFAKSTPSFSAATRVDDETFAHEIASVKRPAAE